VLSKDQRPPGNLAATRLAKLAMAVVVPVVFFACVEAGLRLGGFGRDTRFFIPDETPGMYRTNPRFTEMFFPASFGLKPVNFRIAKQKPAGTVRIFVLGESAAMGVPEPAFAIAPQMRAQLRAVRPGERVEVISLGVTAIDSHAIVEIARQAVEFDPDLFVVYMGNNEVVGPFGASSVVTGGTPPRALIRAGVLLKSTRTGQLLQRAIGALRSSGGAFREWGGMEMFTGKAVAVDDPRLDPIRANFSANLDQILSIASDHDIKTVLSTVAVNVRDCAPFASVTAGPLQALLETDRALALGRAGDVHSLLEQAVAAAPGHAGARFRLARSLDARGETPTAREHYFAALEFDALRFRADSEINAIIRQAAQSSGGRVSLVDSARELGSDIESSTVIAGREFFFEHVHLTWEGNFALAKLLAARAVEILWDIDPATAPWLDRDACAASVGFTEFGRLAQLMSMQELTGRPPFTGQWLFAEDRARQKREIGTAQSTLSSPEAVQAVVAQVDGAIARDPENAALVFQAAAVHLQAGDVRGALEFNDRYAELAPPSGEHAVQRAYLLMQVGRGSEAADVLLQSAVREPYYFQTYSLLAQVRIANGQAAQAVDEFVKLSERMPGSRVVRGTQARLLAHTGDWDGAEREWRAILEQAPDDESVLDPFVDRLLNTRRLDLAIELMLRAYTHNPRSFANNARLVEVFSEKGDSARTVEYMRALAASGPVNARFHLDLAQHLGELDRSDEMKAELQRARDVARAEEDSVTLRAAEEFLRRTSR
jgi:tetratricopeptide (TPR) repeat protein